MRYARHCQGFLFIGAIVLMIIAIPLAHSAHAMRVGQPQLADWQSPLPTHRNQLF
jgi:hypothetical protein